MHSTLNDPELWPNAVEVAIIGGGVVGTSIAYNLAERGVSAVVIFEKGRVGEGATSASAGGMRYQFSTEVNVRLSLLSIGIFEEFPERFGQEIDLHQNGYLMLTSTEEMVEHFRTNVAMQRRLGVDVQLLTPKEAQQIAPYLNIEDVLGVTFCPDDGYADPYNVVQGYANRARALGVKILEETEVTGIQVEEGRACGVIIPNGEIQARYVVNAAGPYAREVGKLVGLDLPVRPYRRQMFVTEPFAAIPEDAPMVVDLTTTFHFHKEEAGGVMMGMSDPDEPSSFNTHVNWTFLERVVEQAVHRVPVFQEAEINRGWAGLYTISPDSNPILGRIPELENFICAIGFSGHGFMHSPAVGIAIAELIAEGEAKTIDITPLGIERFSKKKTEAGEQNVI